MRPPFVDLASVPPVSAPLELPFPLPQLQPVRDRSASAFHPELHVASAASRRASAVRVSAAVLSPQAESPETSAPQSAPAAPNLASGKRETPSFRAAARANQCDRSGVTLEPSLPPTSQIRQPGSCCSSLPNFISRLPRRSFIPISLRP